MNRSGTNLIVAVLRTTRMASLASGAIFTNHCAEMIGSTSLWQR